MGECAVTLEDVAIILGLPTDGLPVTGMTVSSFEALEAECLHQFGVAPSVHWKFLPLLCDFESIGQYNWRSTYLAHLYRALCRTSRYDCKEIDGPLTLLLGWAWIRLPYLEPLPREPRSFSLANMSVETDAIDILRLLTLGRPWMIFRKARCVFIKEFVWVAYAVDRVDPDIIPPDIYMHSGVPHQEQNLNKAHGEVLIGPKNLNWTTVTTHSFWVMQWTNMYNHILTKLPMPSQHSLDTFKYWYRKKFGDRLNLSNLVVQENDEGNQDMDVDNQEQEPQSPAR
ncbi:uncharacterized protein DS421_13g399240 [Arachis hypogaea]|nr:uncharacterized protein DS421_13g399240 [Arachis hypogaea]